MPEPPPRSAACFAKRSGIDPLVAGLRGPERTNVRAWLAVLVLCAGCARVAEREPIVQPPGCLAVGPSLAVRGAPLEVVGPGPGLGAYPEHVVATDDGFRLFHRYDLGAVAGINLLSVALDRDARPLGDAREALAGGGVLTGARGLRSEDRARFAYCAEGPTLGADPVLRLAETDLDGGPAGPTVRVSDGCRTDPDVARYFDASALAWLDDAAPATARWALKADTWGREGTLAANATMARVAASERGAVFAAARENGVRLHFEPRGEEVDVPSEAPVDALALVQAEPRVLLLLATEEQLVRVWADATGELDVLALEGTDGRHRDLDLRRLAGG